MLAADKCFRMWCVNVGIPFFADQYLSWECLPRPMVPGGDGRPLQVLAGAAMLLHWQHIAVFPNLQPNLHWRLTQPVCCLPLCKNDCVVGSDIVVCARMLRRVALLDLPVRIKGR